MIRMPHRARPVHEAKANLFLVLGHPARVRILELLRDGERSVGALQAELELDSGGTSQHLAALRRRARRGRRGAGPRRAAPTARALAAPPHPHPPSSRRPPPPPPPSPPAPPPVPSPPPPSRCGPPMAALLNRGPLPHLPARC